MCPVFFSDLWDDHVKDVLDFSKITHMKTRELLRCRTILAFLLVAPLHRRKGTCFQSTLTPKNTRKHHVWLEATLLEPSSHLLLFPSPHSLPSKPTFPPMHIPHSFKALPISYYRNSNSWCHVNNLHLSVYISPFLVKLFCTAQLLQLPKRE